MNRMIAFLLLAVALVSYLISLAASAFFGVDYDSALFAAGLRSSSPLSARITYQFFHAGVAHLAGNVITMVTLAFGGFRLLPSAMVAAFVISASVPDVCLSETPVVGMSGVCYAIVGMLSFIAEKPLRFHAVTASFVAAGWFLSMAVAVHAYCYVVGLAYAWFVTPRSWKS